MSHSCKPIWFLHVTKCGGTSLRTAIMQSLREGGAHPAQFHLHDAVTSSRLAAQLGVETFSLRDAMLGYELVQNHRRFIAGHFRYTQHLHEPLLSRCLPITLLRDPVDRFLSLFYYNSFKSTDYGKETLPLEAYLERPRARRSAEDYVRLFRGAGGSHNQFADAAGVRSAVQNLRRFAVVGTLDDLPAFVASLEQQAGIRVSIPMQNRSPAPEEARHRQIDEAMLEHIKALCEPSIEVYETVLATASMRS